VVFEQSHTTLITKEEAHIFLGMVSDVGNENNISLKGISIKNPIKINFGFLEFLKAMREWKV
jgi:hypothetical protein